VGNSIFEYLIKLNLSVAHPTLKCDRLMEREAWQQTQPNDEQIEIFKQTVQELIKLQSKNQIISKVKQSS
jgi:hypothetical protein